MSHNKLPKGAIRTDWTETVERHWMAGDRIFVEVWYDAAVEYDSGQRHSFVAPAYRVELYCEGDRLFAREYYGETAESDAERELGDAFTKAVGHPFRNVVGELFVIKG